MLVYKLDIHPKQPLVLSCALCNLKFSYPIDSSRHLKVHVHVSNNKWIEVTHAQAFPLNECNLLVRTII